MTELTELTKNGWERENRPHHNIQHFAKNKHGKLFAINVEKTSSVVSIRTLNKLLNNTRRFKTFNGLSVSPNMMLITDSYFDDKVETEGLKAGVELIDKERWEQLTSPPQHFELREYQNTVINDSLKKYNSNQARLLIEMATGLGKTYTVAHLVKNLLDNQNYGFKRVLFLAHQKEILLQSVSAFKRTLTNTIGDVGKYSFSVCFEGAALQDTDFAFATFQTLKNKLQNIQHFDLIIVDEAHHARATVYERVINSFTPKLLVGLTATPFHSTGKSVIDFFGGDNGHIGRYNLIWALGQKHAYLAEPKYLVYWNNTVVDAGLEGNDANAFLDQDYEKDAITRIEDTITNKQIENPKCIVFCRNIKHINQLIEFFPTDSAISIHSKMSSSQRKENIKYFRQNPKCRYILVRDLFNEGIDIPETNMLVFMRYTGSYTVWLQQLGRGLRKTKPQGQEEFVYILDFVSSFERLNEIETLAKDVNDVRNKQNNNNQVDNLTVDIATINDDGKNKTPVTFTDPINTNLVDTLENLKRRLGEEIRSTFDEGEGIPSMEDTLIIINELTSNQELVNQIKTEYTRYGLIKDNFDSSEYSKEEQLMKAQVLNGVVASYERNQQVISPSIFKEISEESRHEDLLNYNESEAEYLVAKKSLYGKKFRSHEELKNYAEVQHKKSELIEKYIDVIKTRQDLLNLHPSDENEIKQVFKCTLILFNRLESHRKQMGV